ncbi:MAG TPA: hypothetical protein VFV10_09640 [Gammaproteobacteria bacterium]|nr:hypothetical protein [Gammaproteobacteria bacterium]
MIKIAAKLAVFGGTLASAVCLTGCTYEEVLLAHSVPLTRAPASAPEHDLLDVGVVVFDSGVPEGEVAPEVKEKLMDAGTFVQVRRAESLYLAVLLRDTLQDSAQWGSVWVTPESSTAADLDVTAKILQSDGALLRLHAKAVDATGRVWINKDYEIETATGAFDRQRYRGLDAYQDVFNEIANDLAAAEHRLGGSTSEVRSVAALRYAGELSPPAFGRYVTSRKDGQYVLNRLPASGDPMFDRTQQVRQREHVFMDTLNDYYTVFANEAEAPYDGWRQSAREEAIAIHEEQKSARWRTGLGVASVLASVVYGGSSGIDSFADRFLRDSLMFMGMDLMQSAATRRQDVKLHVAALEELSASFDNEVEPLVVEINGTQHRLSGTAEAQYEEWRDLLERMFDTEAGVGEARIYSDPDVRVHSDSAARAPAASGEGAATGEHAAAR